MKFRKKPVVIDAVQNGGEWAPVMAFLDSLTPDGQLAIPFGSRPSVTRNASGTLNIETLEGTMLADLGDWLICGVKGELYPCKPDIFEATYEAVEEASGEPLVHICGDDGGLLCGVQVEGSRYCADFLGSKLATCPDCAARL